MGVATVKNELNTYLTLLSARQQALVLDMVKNLLHIDNKEKRISAEQYNIEIEAALKEVKQGKTVTHNDVLNNTKKWLKRR